MTMSFSSLLGLTEAATGAVDATAATGATAVNTTTELLGMLIPLVLMFVVFYFLLIRPQRKKDKKVKDMLAALKVGDRICTIGGIYGTIVSIKDETIELSVGKDNVKLIFARWAIRNVEEVAVENDSEVLN
ncbi:MAG: preprotein translocase subunit YajC [Eubacteriales bacterium]|nr:preprotein translocase subunit YajC [Eubacteriales bacterium]